MISVKVIGILRGELPFFPGAMEKFANINIKHASVRQNLEPKCCLNLKFYFNLASIFLLISIWQSEQIKLN